MCGDYNLRREKRYVEVDVRFTPDGKIRPLAINYDKAHTYGIDRVLNRASGSWKPTALCRKAVLRNGKVLIPRRPFAHSG